MDEVTHLHIQQQGLIGILDIEGVKISVFGNDRHVGLLPEMAGRGFHADDILGTVSLAGNQVG